MLDRGAVCPEFVAAMDDVHFLRKFGQVCSLFDCSVSSADNGDGFVLEERPVANGAVAHTLADMFRFAFASETAEIRAGADDDSFRLNLFLFRDDDLPAFTDFHLAYIRVAEFGIEFFGVLAEHVSKLLSACMLHSGPIFYLIGDVDLSARSPLFQQKNIQPGSAAVNRRSQTCRPGADNDKLPFFHHCHLLSRTPLFNKRFHDHFEIIHDPIEQCEKYH